MIPGTLRYIHPPPPVRALLRSCRHRPKRAGAKHKNEAVLPSGEGSKKSGRNRWKTFPQVQNMSYFILPLMMAIIMLSHYIIPLKSSPLWDMQLPGTPVATPCNVPAMMMVFTHYTYLSSLKHSPWSLYRQGCTSKSSRYRKSRVRNNT